MAVRQSADLFYSQDIAFVRTLLTRINTDDPVLRGTMRLDAVFGAGHSSGFGSVMSAYAQRYPGLKGLISFDAGVSGIARDRGVDVPLLLVRAEDPSYTGVLIRGPKMHARGTIYDSAFVRATTAPFIDLQLLGTGHAAVFDNLARLGAADGAQVRAAHALIAWYTREFLASVMRGTVALDLRPADADRVHLQWVTRQRGSRP